jgi:hypothetical protein
MSTGVDPKNQLYPIAVLIDELKNEDKKKRFVNLFFNHLYMIN